MLQYFIKHFAFFSGQARIDGAFCDFTEENRNDYLTELHQQGVRNVEMQAIPFAAITHHAGIKAAIVCVTLMDKLKSDQVCFNYYIILLFQLSPLSHFFLSMYILLNFYYR